MSEPAGIEVSLEFDREIGRIWQLDSFLARVRAGRIMVKPHLDYQIRDQGTTYYVKGYTLITFANASVILTRHERASYFWYAIRNRFRERLQAATQQCLFLMYWAGLPYNAVH